MSRKNTISEGQRGHNAACELLIIDELAFEPMNRQETSLFFRLVPYRYARGAILITTTNKSVREWSELLAGDEVLTTAILDRLLHKAHVLNIKGPQLPAARPRAGLDGRSRMNTIRSRRLVKGGVALL